MKKRKSIKKFFTIVASISLLSSALSFNSSAEILDDRHDMIMERQETCQKEYEKLLLSFVDNNILDYPDEYGGIYFDNGTGITTLCLTDINKSIEYSSYFNDSILKFKKVEYSLDELNETYQFISKNMKENNITTVSVSEKNNNIEISVPKDSDKSNVLDYINSNGFSTESIIFIENSAPEEYEIDSLSTNVNFAYSGSEMYAATSGATYVGTVGTNAYNPNTNQYGIITAGHMANISGTYSFKNSSSVVFNNNSGVNCIFGGVCDIAFIPFNSSNSFMSTSTLKNGNNTTCIYDTQPIVSPYMVGFEVVKYGTTTGKQTGVLTNLSSSITYSDGTNISDMIKYDMNRAGGDSGAPMGIEYSNGDGLYFMGIHSGGSGTSCYATKYRNIVDNLGVVITEVTQ